MSALEEFENAPVGTRARSKEDYWGIKTYGDKEPWHVSSDSGDWSETLTDRQMWEWNFHIIDPAPTVPTSARDALDLAWELAHPVREGQVIPAGTMYLARYSDGSMDAYDVIVKQDVRDVSRWEGIRTLDPLPEPEPEPEPDWLDAPAVLATCGCRGIGLWRPHNEKDGMWESVSGEQVLWSTLRYVTPLYPKEDE